MINRNRFLFRLPNLPVSVETSITLLARDPRFAGALPGLQVALGVLTGLAAAALQTAGLAVQSKAPVIRLTHVTPLPHHPGQTLALATDVVTLPGPLPVTRARRAVLGLDGVTIVPWLTPLTPVSSCVEQTELADAGDSVTGVVIRHINIAITLTGFTLATRSLRLSEVSGTTGFASVPDIVGLTQAVLVLCVLREEAITGQSETRLEKCINSVNYSCLSYLLSGRGHGQD